MSLSCTSCRRRKIKCDKLDVCGPCQKASLPCEYPERQKPTKRKRELADFDIDIARNHNVLLPNGLLQERRHLGRPPAATDEDLSGQYASFVHQQDNTPLINTAFWSQLEGHAESHDDSELKSKPINPRSVAGSGNNASPSFIFGNNPTGLGETPHIHEKQRIALFEIYFSRVHPVFRMLHQPIGFEFLRRIKDLSDPATQRLEFKSMEAIYCAITLTGLISLSAAECQIEFDVEQKVMEGYLRHDLETALTACDLPNTREIVTLQAFILYILSTYSTQSTQSSWALLGLAVRIAQGLGLHRDGDGASHDRFHAEMRRRIWWFLVLLDILLSNDRGSEPLIMDPSFTTRRPLHINDDDINRQSPSPISERSRMADMTIPLTYMDGLSVLRTINAPQLPVQEKADLASAFSQRLEQKYLRIGGDEPKFDLTDARTWLVYMSGQLLSLMMWLAVQYPLHGGRDEPHDIPKRHALRTAVALLALKQQIEQNSFAAPFLWWFRMFEPWHALAVALSILCSETSGKTVDQAWPIVNQAYERCTQRFSHANHGDLCSPLQSLMSKARAARSQEIPFKGPDASAVEETRKSKTGEAKANGTNVHQPILDLTFEPTETTPIIKFGSEMLAWNVDPSPGDSGYGNDSMDDWNTFVNDLSYMNFDFSANGTDTWLVHDF